MYDCKAPLSRFYYPDTRRIINAFIIYLKLVRVHRKQPCYLYLQYDSIYIKQNCVYN